MKDDSKSEVLGATAGDAGNLRMRVVDWQRQTIDELRQATPIQEQMIVTILATAWRPEAQVWDEATLTTLLKSFARDVNTATEHKVEIAMRSIESGAAVLEAFASAHIIGLLTNEALRVAISKRQLDEFFRCWLSRPLVAGDLVPFEQTFMSKLLRLGVTGLVVSNVFVFIMLFIIPEFQKMYAEFGLEMTSASQFLMIWADRTAKLWFIPFFLLLVLGFFFIRGSSFANWWRRWSSRLWTAQDWSNKDRSRLVAAWELRPAGVSATSNGAAASTSAESGASPTVDRWQTPSLASVLTKSESATLALTEDQELKDWLLEKMVSSRKEQRASIRNAWATILLGAGHCLIGLVVLLVAISVFGSLLEIIHGLAGGRP